MELDDIVTTVSGTPITVRDVVIHLKASGAFRNAVYQLIETEVVRQQCEAHDVRLQSGELDAYAELRRRELGLTDAIAMNSYCRWLGITFEQWQTGIQTDLLKQKLAEKVVAPDMVEQYYMDHKEQLRTATLSRLVCHSREEAENARQLVTEGSREFFSVARECSIEAGTRMSGGYIGTVTKGVLKPEVDAAVFSSTGPGILGPFPESGCWTLYELMSISNGELVGDVAVRIKSELFAKWMDTQLKHAKP